MFGDLHAPVREVEDLATDDSLGRAVMERRAASGAEVGSVKDESVWLRDLSESRSVMRELTAGLAPGLLSEAPGALDLVPGRVGRGRQVRVVGVAGDGHPTLDLVLQLAEAPEELIVELLLLKQFLRLTCERALGTGEFLRERGDDGLWRTDGLRFKLINAVGEAVDEADDGLDALRVHPADMSFAE
jgi:hypothetical protein